MLFFDCGCVLDSCLAGGAWVLVHVGNVFGWLSACSAWIVLCCSQTGDQNKASNTTRGGIKSRSWFKRWKQ